MSEEAKAAKKRRLAEALRANLRRRKAAGATSPDGDATAAAAQPPVGHPRGATEEG